MANTQGFELIIQAAQSVVVKALKGAWKSAECPDVPDDTGRIPEFMDIPPGGDIGGFQILDGQIQIPQDELDAAFAPEINGVELILGLNAQVEIDDPPVPSAQLIDFHVVLHAKSPVGTLPDSQDVGILLADIIRSNVSAVLDLGHPLDASMDELLQDYVHEAYETGVIQNYFEEYNVDIFLGETASITTQVFDDESNVARQILTSFHDPSTLQISIPIYLRMFSFIPNLLGLDAPMGIETRIIINAPFEKLDDRYVAKFDEVTLTAVTMGPISGAASDIAGNPNESDNYDSNKSTLAAFGQNLDVMLTNKLAEKGVEFSQDLGRQEVLIPSTTEIETLIADLFFEELRSRSHLAIWSPSASDEEFSVDSVDVNTSSDALNIALNDTGSASINALSNFIPADMEFGIAMSKDSLEEKIQKSITDNGFDDLPKRFVEDGKDVDLNSLSISIINNAIRLQGTVTVIDAVLGSIDVDASFTTDVGLHWEPSGSLSSSGFQELKHHIIGEPDVDVDEGVAFWIIAIILAVISFGAGGVLIGVISIIVILIVQAIVENIGSDTLVNGVTGAIDGITAWPPELSNIGRVKAVFFDPVDISTTGLVISGQFEVISSCEATAVVPATTAGKYIVNATQTTELKALRIYNLAEFFWNPGDGSASQFIKTIYHSYDNSGIYLAKHGVNVTETGGAESRHFALVRVKNVPAVVDAGPDITVNEGEIVTLEASFEDVEYLDTHWSIWNFGDDQVVSMGVVEETNFKPASKGVSRVEHAWCDNGEYHVSVQVIDNNGGVGTDTLKVTVLNVPPKVTSPEKQYAYACSPITLRAVFTDPGWCDTHTATWEFGDCTGVKIAKVEEINEKPEARGNTTASHVYKTCGTYSAECIVLDDDDGMGVSRTIVEVISLKNAYFNDGFSYDRRGKVANYWRPCVIDSGSVVSTSVSRAEENYFCEKCYVYDGLSSQKICAVKMQFSGIYQCLGANKGWSYQVDCMYLLNDANGMAKLGIDPTGGSNPASSKIIWSEGTVKEQWSNLLQCVNAEGDCITIFLGLSADEPGLAECCFDAVEVIAVQNNDCDAVAEPVPSVRQCIDFKDVNLKEELPVEWHYKSLKFVSMAKSPNRIVRCASLDDENSLRITRGLILEFDQAVSDLILEFCYSKEIYVGVIAMDALGEVVSDDNHELISPSMKINVEGKKISWVQIFIRGKGSLFKLCFRRMENETRRI